MHTEEELREIAYEWFFGKILTSDDIEDKDFLEFIFPIPSESIKPTPIRARCIESLGLDELKEDEEYPIIKTSQDMIVINLNGEDKEFFKDRFEIVYSKPDENIGMIFEYLELSNGYEIDGYPTFTSCHILNKKDAVKVRKFREILREANFGFN